MNSASAASPPPLRCIHHQYRTWRNTDSIYYQSRDSIPLQYLKFQISSSLFRPRRHRRQPPKPHRSDKPSPSDRKLEVSIDVDNIADGALSALSLFYRSSEARICSFISSGADAYEDLRTSVRFDGGGHRIFFSCRQSSLLFAANLIGWSFVALLAVRWFWSGLREGSGNWAVIRRDRSLAGREVVVARRSKRRDAEGSFRVSMLNPLSPPRGAEMKIRESMVRKQSSNQKELPNWWPDSTIKRPDSVIDHEYQREADILARAIMDKRISGKDFDDADVIQLRRICKISGAKVCFDTTNACVSFYRASVDLVLNYCSRVSQPTATILIDGEEARRFIVGLAHNISLEDVQAATLIRAAVAARTRSSLLQSWALEVQGKKSDALEILSEICQIILIFPLEEDSPEMEMVASGLKKNLGLKQREHLLCMFEGLCGAEEAQRMVAEALALMNIRRSGGIDMSANRSRRRSW